MKNYRYCFFFVVLFAACFFGCSKKQTILVEREAIWEVYEKECQKCHRAHGRGSLIGRLFFKVPDFTDVKWQDNASDSRLIIHVANGLRKMPSFKGKLKDEEIVDLVKTCVRSFYPAVER
ncbi:MAG: cytochrome c [Candidatus Kuenenia sp.]|nr:cytochrome c [Candidatus Kuenenia hertensis]